MDVFLIIFILVFVLMAFVVSGKMFLYYEMPEDKGVKQLPFVKLVIVCALSLAWLMILLLPLDVRNSREIYPTLDMQTFWIITFIFCASFIVLIIPLAMSYYDIACDDGVKKKWRWMVFQTIAGLVITALVVGITYIFLRKAKLPVRTYTCKLSDTGPCNSAPTPGTMDIKVSFEIYLVAVMCFVGWLIFSFFGGIGLTSLPLGFIFAFIDRPQAVDITTYAEKKRMYGETAAGLIDQAKNIAERDSDLRNASGLMAKRKKQKLKTDFNKFKQTAYLLEQEYEKLEVGMKQRGENPLVSWSKLVAGILLAILSFVWWLHVILYVLIGSTSIGPIRFLNDFLIMLDNGKKGTQSPIFIFAVVVYAVLNAHLLACVISGCMKVGMRIFCLPIHPMKAANTPLSSMLFNCIIMLLGACAITQFSQATLGDYARATSAVSLFEAEIRYLNFYTYFFNYNVFYWIFVVWAVLATLFLMIKPRDLPALNLDGRAEKAFRKVMAGMKAEVVKAAVT